jgi:hypothetical protein
LLFDEAQALSGLLEAHRQALETQELEARLSELEGRANASHGFKQFETQDYAIAAC